jgi:transposase
MSLRPHTLEPVPEETARVACGAFPKGNPYLLLRDTLGTIFQDDDFTACFPRVGKPGLPPWRLALVTLMQFRENLADRQAAEAVRARIDWKYLLGLPLTDPGFDFSVLSEFRDRLLASRPSENDAVTSGKVVLEIFLYQQLRYSPRLIPVDKPDVMRGRKKICGGCMKTWRKKFWSRQVG